jgi:hypothetical protein
MAIHHLQTWLGKQGENKAITIPYTKPGLFPVAHKCKSRNFSTSCPFVYPTELLRSAGVQNKL